MEFIALATLIVVLAVALAAFVMTSHRRDLEVARQIHDLYTTELGQRR